MSTCRSDRRLITLGISPAAALACLEAPTEDWARLQPGSCALQWLITPELTAARPA